MAKFRAGDRVRVTHGTWLDMTDGMVGEIGQVIVAGETECWVRFNEQYGVMCIWNTNMEKVM